ncbi:LysR family transcriptional regulator [Chelativorans sp. YIM 93263]|uniref:LysR family transcriptional regulator n=1 Tax=Chelativorans sp. YIM 93263 TaxID=2906648 RepID=UPI002378FDBE|nr:LysR substrate-binding domain-containing protein [Chelativorans sp. YIM 93263]
MELRQLRTFINVAELKSISAAAERLHIAQPALSRQIQSLEEELGVCLLRRHGRGVEPTEEGEFLVERANVVLKEIERIYSEIKTDDPVLRGSISLGLPPTVADVLATPIIERTYYNHPDVRLRVVSGFSGFVQDWLQRGTIDIGVTYEGREVHSVRSHPLLLEELFLIQPAEASHDDQPVSCADALRQKLILPGSPHALRKLLDMTASNHGVTLNVVLEADTLPTLLELVRRGLGSTVLPLVSVFDEVRKGRLRARRIVDPAITRKLVLWTPIDRPSSRLTQQFTAMLIDEVYALVASKRWPGTTL